MSRKPRFTAKQRKEMKNKICEILGKTPIIETACRRVGISRMTFYRWQEDDPVFAGTVDEVLSASRESVNDLAESRLIQKVDEGNMPAIMNWLTHNCDRYQKASKGNTKKIQTIKWVVPPSPFMNPQVRDNPQPRNKTAVYFV